MIKILFVCQGNICRSPMAEFVMKNMVKEQAAALAKVGLREQDFEIASAATSTEEIGNPVYPPVRRLLAGHHIDCSHKRARQMAPQDFDYYDYIVAMDHYNLQNMRWILPGSPNKSSTKKVSLLMDYTNRPGDVADPWYTRDFNATWIDICEGCSGLLKNILSHFC